MGRNKGAAKTGGRVAGTPNKNSAQIKALITDLLQDNADQIRKDFTQLTPAERIKAVSQLAAYVVPRQTAVSVEQQAAIEKEGLLLFLETAPEDAINAIAEKVLLIQANMQEATREEINANT
jgi:hypothetical protein